MRITSRVMSSNYIYNANKSLENLSKQNNKLYTGRAFSKISENVTSGKKALEARTEAYRNAQYLKNVSSASEQISTAETALTSINDQIQNIMALAEKAVNGTNGDDTSRQIFSATLQESKNAILDDINSNHAGKYILGGTNNISEPYTVDADGDLNFNGIKIDEISMSEGTYFDKDGNSVPMSHDIYLDVGKELRLNGDVVDEKSAMKISFTGAEWTGYGKSEITYKNADGNEVTAEVSNNVYQLMTEMQTALDDGDMEKLSELNAHMKKQYDNLLTGIAQLGVRSKTLESKKSVLEDKEDSIATLQQNLEGIKDTDEIVKMQEYQYAWNLTLKFGSSVLPQSLLDYL